MKILIATCALAIAIIAAVAIYGLRLFVIPPIGALPDGATVIIAGAPPEIQLVESADAMCLREADMQNLLCRGAMLALVANKMQRVAVLPYSRFLDRVALKMAEKNRADGLKQTVSAPDVQTEEKERIQIADARPDCLQLSLGRVYAASGYPHAIVSVENGCGQTFETVRVECAWLQGDNLVAAGRGYIKNLAGGETGSERILDLQGGVSDVDDARCRIDDVR